jgi:hypothetical protein
MESYRLFREHGLGEVNLVEIVCSFGALFHVKSGTQL